MKRIYHLLVTLVFIMTPFHAFSEREGPSVVDALLKPKDIQPLPNSSQKTPVAPESAALKEMTVSNFGEVQEEQSMATQTEQKRAQGLYVTINATVDAHQRYVVTMQSADENPLFIFPLQIDPSDSTKKQMVKSSLLKRFFDFDKQKFVFDSKYLLHEPSYAQTINALSEPESKLIFAQQSLLSKARNYYLESIIGSHLKKAKLIVSDALIKLNQALRNAFGENAYKLLDQNKLEFEHINIKDPAYSNENAKPRMIYNAIREFGQVIGFEMPSIEKPWYMRHKGKIALTAGAVALLGLAYYSSAFGTRPLTQAQSSPIESSKGISLGVAERTPAVAQSSWFARSLAAAKTKFSTTLSNFKSEAAKTAAATAQKETSKAIVSRIARNRGIGPQIGAEGPSTSKTGDVIGHALIQEGAAAYGYELVPKPGSNIQRPISIPESARGAVIEKLFKPAEEGGAGIEESFREWR